MGLFGRKNEKSDRNIEEIKKVVEEDKNPPKVEEFHESPLDRLLKGKLDEFPADVKPPEETKKLPESAPEERKAAPMKPKEEPVEVEKPSFAPLFVKIDRYRQILNAIGSLKTTMIMLKNSLLTLNELDKARDETFKLVQDAVGKLEGKLNSLDQELVRPSGFQERTNISHDTTSERPEYQDVETVEATIADLKGQIEQLKSELETVA